MIQPTPRILSHPAFQICSVLVILITFSGSSCGRSLFSSDADYSALKATYHGTYEGSRIKSSSSDSADASLDDMTEMVTALKELNINLIGYPAQDGDDDEPCFITDENGTSTRNYTLAGQDWCQFLELLEATKDTDIKIFAHQKERHLGGGTNRWLSVDTSGYTAQSKEAHDPWLAAWLSMIPDLADLAEQYPNFIGFTIDDFGVYICGNDYHYNGSTDEEWCYTKEEVQAIHDAAHAIPNFHFWPTLYFEACTARVIDQSYILGSPYSVKRNTGDYALMKLTVTLDEIPAEAKLSYFLRDTNNKDLCEVGDNAFCDLTTCETALTDYQTCMMAGGYSSAKETECQTAMDALTAQIETCTVGVSYYIFTHSLAINASTIYKEHLVGDDYIDQYDLDITSYLNPIAEGSSKNEITFRVDFQDGKNAFQNALVYISNLKFTLDGEELTCSETSETCQVSYETLSENTGSAGDDADTGYEYTEIFAQDNADYRVNDVVDGILSPYRADSVEYDETYYENLIKVTKESLGSKELLVVNYAGMWGTVVDTTILAKQAEAAGKQADALLLISYPLALMAPEKGIFLHRESWDSAYALLSYWPNRQAGFEGYYQKFTSKEELSGQVTVTIDESQDSSAYAGEYFYKEISDANGTFYYQDYIGNNNGEPETVTFDLGTTPTKLIIEISETNGVGSLTSVIYMNVKDKDGNMLSNSDFDFESWTDNEQILAIHNMMQTVFSAYQESP